MKRLGGNFTLNAENQLLRGSVLADINKISSGGILIDP